MRISDWSADVCSSDLPVPGRGDPVDGNTWRDRRTRQGSARHPCADVSPRPCAAQTRAVRTRHPMNLSTLVGEAGWLWLILAVGLGIAELLAPRSEEHTSELQSLMRISYAVFCLKKKTINLILHHR